VVEMFLEVYPQRTVDERQIEPAAVISVKDFHAFQGFGDAVGADIFPDELHEIDFVTAAEVNADDSYFAAGRSQPGCLYIQVRFDA